jgi:polysaccharide export outer membrane protein
MLARVGGKTSGGAGYVVLTPAQGEAKRFQISGLATGTGAEDPIVNAGDKIFIPSIEDEVFYISGEVKNPGPQPTTPNTTVRIALARSGGVTENGNEKKVTVVRAGKKLPRANLETVIEPGDVITIGARLF